MGDRMNDPSRPRITIVGDGSVGKTSVFQFLTSVTEDDARQYMANPGEGVKNGFDFEFVELGGMKEVAVVDTSGVAAAKPERVRMYPGTDIVIYCFSSKSKISLANITTWSNEVREVLKESEKGMPWSVLVRLQSDLGPKLTARVASADILNTADKLKASAVVATSAKHWVDGFAATGLDELRLILIDLLQKKSHGEPAPEHNLTEEDLDIRLEAATEKVKKKEPIPEATLPAESKAIEEADSSDSFFSMMLCCGK